MTLRTPPLRDAHEARGAKFTEFGGWEMPVEFDSIRTEHASVRNEAGKFDVSHMGEVTVSGPGAERLTQRLTSNDVSALSPGRAQYSMITDEDGVIVDDTVVYRLPEGSDDDYLFVPNAGHDDEMTDRWTTHRDEWGLEAEVRNATEEYALFAVQGSDAEALVADAAGDADAVREIGRFHTAVATVAGVDVVLSRTGYTGEDGFELFCPWDDAEAVWGAFDCQPCGLGARDTLRTEMGFLLSGQDFDRETNPRNPFEAGVGFAVDLNTEFVGRDALERVREAGIDETFTGLRLTERGVPRHGYAIVDEGGEAIGEVTSGTMSPTLDEPIGLGYVPVEYAEDGTAAGVVVRGETKSATIVTPPFLEGYE